MKRSLFQTLLSEYLSNSGLRCDVISLFLIAKWKIQLLVDISWFLSCLSPNESIIIIIIIIHLYCIIIFLVVSCLCPKWINPGGKSHTGPEFTASLRALWEMWFLVLVEKYQCSFNSFSLIIHIGKEWEKSWANGSSEKVIITFYQKFPFTCCYLIYIFLSDLTNTQLFVLFCQYCRVNIDSDYEAKSEKDCKSNYFLQTSFLKQL